MAAPPARTEISDTYPNPSNAVARAGFGKLYDYAVGLLGSTGNSPEARVALGVDGAITTIASASTINLDSVLTPNIEISGTTGISAITLTSGRAKRIKFQSALTLTNSSNLVLPGAANITTAAGDYADVVGKASSVVHCTNYQTAAETPKPANSLGTAGYAKFPFGSSSLIVQWGTSVVTLSAGAGTITLPLTFGTIYTVIACNGDTTATTINPGVTSTATNGFNFLYSGAGNIATRTNWVAFGI